MRSDMDLFVFEKSANLKRPNVHFHQLMMVILMVTLQWASEWICSIVYSWHSLTIFLVPPKKVACITQRLTVDCPVSMNLCDMCLEIFKYVMISLSRHSFSLQCWTDHDNKRACQEGNTIIQDTNSWDDLSGGSKSNNHWSAKTFQDTALYWPVRWNIA